MRLIIKPGDDSLETILLTGPYQRLWWEHSHAILTAFHQVTGLSFRQSTITALVYPSHKGESGWYHHAMRLPGKFSDKNDPLIVLVHELSHRLLSGNALYFEAQFSRTLSQEYAHRLSYLFDKDVIQEALGGKHARRYMEAKSALCEMSNGHTRAWHWVSSLSPEVKRRAVRRLVDYTPSQDEVWVNPNMDIRDKPADKIDVWFATLIEP